MVADKAFDLSIDSRKVYISDIPIKGKSFVRVFIDSVGEGGWSIIDESNYQIIDDSIVFNVAPTGAYLVMQVATTPVELTSTPNDATLILALNDDIKAVTANITPIIAISDNIDGLALIGDNIIEILQADDNALLASNKASEASASALLASNKASEASASALLASNKASEASASATSAFNSSSASEGFRDEAEGFAISINPSDIVHKTGDETINGTKTFTSFPITPSLAPTLDYQVANKKFVVDNTPTIANATSSVKGIDYKGLLTEYEVTGSARTSIDFSGLDINTHKSYRVEIELVCVSACALYCFVNADTTVTNYYTQTSGGAATAWSGGRYNYPSVIQANATGSQIGNLLIERVNGVPSFVGIGSSQLSTTPVFYNYFTLKTATVTNITQLTFTSSVASAIGVGSKIRIYRGDV